MRCSKILLVLTVILSNFASAEFETSRLPTCALTCLDDLIPQSTCTTTNATCLCSDPGLQMQFDNCIGLTCQVKDTLTTQNLTATNCDLPIRDRSRALRGAQIPLISIATIFVFARIIGRLPCFGSELGIDDAFIVTTWLLALAFTVSLFIRNIGFGRDIWTVPFDQIYEILKLITALGDIYIPIVWFTKISILLQYLRIFPDDTFRRRVKIGIGMCSAAVFCLFWAYFFKCWPISFGWNYWDGQHKGSCTKLPAQAWANSMLNTSADIIVLLLPVPSIWRLNLATNKRLQIMSMFSIGIFVALASMIRLKWIKLFSLSRNVTWDFVDLALWSSVEIYIGIVCACLPGMRNFNTRVFQGKIIRRLSTATVETATRRTSVYSERLRRKSRAKNDTTLMMTTDHGSIDESRSREKTTDQV